MGIKMKIYLTSKQIGFGLYKSPEYFRLAVENCYDIKYWIIDQDMIKWFKSQKIDYIFNVNKIGYDKYITDITNNHTSINRNYRSLIIWAEPHFTFKKVEDAILFKLTWG